MSPDSSDMQVSDQILIDLHRCVITPSLERCYRARSDELPLRSRPLSSKSEDIAAVEHRHFVASIVTVNSCGCASNFDFCTYSTPTTVSRSSAFTSLKR